MRQCYFEGGRQLLNCFDVCLCCFVMLSSFDVCLCCLFVMLSCFHVCLCCLFCFVVLSCFDVVLFRCLFVLFALCVLFDVCFDNNCEVQYYKCNESHGKTLRTQTHIELFTRCRWFRMSYKPETRTHRCRRRAHTCGIRIAQIASRGLYAHVHFWNFQIFPENPATHATSTTWSLPFPVTMCSNPICDG